MGGDGGGGAAGGNDRGAGPRGGGAGEAGSGFDSTHAGNVTGGGISGIGPSAVDAVTGASSPYGLGGQYGLPAVSGMGYRIDSFGTPGYQIGPQRQPTTGQKVAAAIAGPLGSIAGTLAGVGPFAGGLIGDFAGKMLSGLSGAEAGVRSIGGILGGQVGGMLSSATGIPGIGGYLGGNMVTGLVDAASDMNSSPNPTSLAGQDTSKGAGTTMSPDAPIPTLVDAAIQALYVEPYKYDTSFTLPGPAPYNVGPLLDWRAL